MFHELINNFEIVIQEVDLVYRDLLYLQRSLRPLLWQINKLLLLAI